MPTISEKSLVYLYIVKFFGTFACPVLYLQSFVRIPWIQSGSHAYGLWGWCDENFTAVNDTRGCYNTNESSRCEDIKAGESPAYFEAVQACAVFTLVAFTLLFFTLKHTEGLAKSYIPATIAFMAGTMCLITVATLMACYGDDSRWKEVDHQLGWCAWTAVGSCGVSYIVSVANFAVARIKHKPATNERQPRESTVPFGQRVEPFLVVARFLGTLTCPVLYIVGFAIQGWVTNDTQEFGLWGWCYTNFSSVDLLENCVNDSSRCHTISPGDSPAYFEGARTCACLTLVAFAMFFLTFSEKVVLGRDYNPAIVAFTAGTLDLITWITFITCYSEDSRWKDSDNKLGSSFYLVTAACVLSFIQGAIHVSFLKLRKTFPIIPKPNSSATDTNNDNNSNNNIDSTNTLTTIDTTATSRAIEEIDPPWHSVSASTSIQTHQLQTPSWGDQGTELSVVGLPHYEVPAYDPSAPYVYHPPPSYEDVIGTGARSPPSVYVVSVDDETQKEHK